MQCMYVSLIVLATVFSKTWYNSYTQENNFLMGYLTTIHLSRDR